MADNSFSKRERLRWAALLVTACVVVYANGLAGSFTYDDKAVVRDNPRIRTTRNLSQIFTTSYFGGPRGSGSAYRPVLLLSFAVEWWVHGRQVVPFHLVNVLLHAAVTLLLASLLLRVGVRLPVVCAAALLYAVHPIHVEAVTSLVGRGETLSALFALGFLHLALRLLREPSHSAFALAGAISCYALSVLTKESGAVAPGLALVLVLFAAEADPGQRLRMALKRWLPLGAFSALTLGGVFALRSWVLGGALKARETGIFEVENPLASLQFLPRAANAILVLYRYLGRSLFPLHLSADESAWSIRPVPAGSPLAIASVLILLAAVGAALARLPRGRVLALGFLFFCVAMLPTENLLFPIGTVFAERIAYLPSAGICLMLGALVAGDTESLAQWSGRRRAALAALALLFAARAVVRNAVWWNDEALFSDLGSTSPRSAKAHYDLGYMFADEGRSPRALAEYKRAIEIYDGYWDAWAGRGRVERALGRLREAEKSYEKSVAVHPSYENGFFGLGGVREALGDAKGAEDAYRTGLEHKSDSLPLAHRLALLRSKRDLPGALADWRRAVTLGPDSVAVRTDFARWLLRQGKRSEAARQAREASRRDPANLAALRLLAERDAQEGWLFAEGLARERAFRVSRSAEDLGPLVKLARRDQAYGRRFAGLRDSLERLAPRLFRETLQTLSSGV
ncbi:MAG TPA: tetratricopeptide repeat protein [Thermoanaerobaculia bacterium]|nr:tetratricopeptide repeat protein [Thermoanaerobaculia bacterium]